MIVCRVLLVSSCLVLTFETGTTADTWVLSDVPLVLVRWLWVGWSFMCEYTHTWIAWVFAIFYLDRLMTPVTLIDGAACWTGFINSMNYLSFTKICLAARTCVYYFSSANFYSGLCDCVATLNSNLLYGLLLYMKIYDKNGISCVRGKFVVCKLVANNLMVMWWHLLIFSSSSWLLWKKLS